ncbi:hypothetical protein Thiowin_03294 [Thiorhodovibrio winogradskyi]|uniref:HTH crp-type domain-containing protein n=1 Tax=Thiorhodovibrio winogradskyi TaxID=77007 RepID=A0ABZ0SB32_9GAMM|nr:helix-turn-helix domain-containing protein [Thiorhodovibrio winogradskyi]
MALDQQSLHTHFGQIWPIHTEAFCELLVALRRQFDGDLDRMLVLAIIGARTLSRGRIDGLSYDGLLSPDRDAKVDPAPINLQSIADYSGIPRETVRRKIRDLERRGWIVKGDNGHLSVAPEAAHALAPATEATLTYLLNVVRACNEATSE